MKKQIEERLEALEKRLEELVNSGDLIDAKDREEKVLKDVCRVLVRCKHNAMHDDLILPYEADMLWSDIASSFITKFGSKYGDLLNE